MDDLLDSIVTDESPSQISDQIKDLLFAKSAEKIDAFRPFVASQTFGDPAAVEDEIDDEGMLELAIERYAALMFSGNFPNINNRYTHYIFLKRK